MLSNTKQQTSSFFPHYPSNSIVVATAYDFPFAMIAEQAGVDAILVGDSLANVVLGFNSTKEVNIDIMTLFTAAVKRGAPNTHIIGDLPYLSYETPKDAINNGRKLLDVGADSVKLEGNKIDVIRALVKENIPVMGHLGLLPQTAIKFSSVGHAEEEKKILMDMAVEMTEAGIYAMVLENTNHDLAKDITNKINIPTIGIGAGKDVSGQVLVLHDLLGISSRKAPPFAKKFADVYTVSLEGLKKYAAEVRGHTFP